MDKDNDAKDLANAPTLHTAVHYLNGMAKALSRDVMHGLMKPVDSPAP